MRVALEIILTDEERAELMKRVRSRLTSVRLEQRAGIVLLAADGFQNKDIAQMLALGACKLRVGDNAMRSTGSQASSATCHAGHHR